MEQYYCYFLHNTNDKYKNHTYCGYTVDPKRRIRQHNGIIKGGAKATTALGDGWEMMMLMTGFKTNNNALSCEWRLKHPDGGRKKNSKYNGVNGRITTLNDVLMLDLWTHKCDIKNSECEYILYVKNILYDGIKINDIPKNIKIVNIGDDDILKYI